MTFLFVLAIFLVGLAIILKFLGSRVSAGQKDSVGDRYGYVKRQFFMTRAENGFYKRLVEATAGKYVIFAQVSLPTLVSEKIPNQDWRAARAHINRKSVDFVLCDSRYLNPLLAIELDDRSHEREDRQDRDVEVERIFKMAGMPLLRIHYSENIVASDLAGKIKGILHDSTAEDEEGHKAV